MAQNYTINCITPTGTVKTELQSMENNFECLRSMFSGSTSISLPTNVAGMPWFDTTTKGLRIRNNANSAWMGVFLAELSTKVWMYSNTEEDGWSIDTAVGDRLLALKTITGGLDYDIDGGNESGTWTMPGCTLSISQIPAHTHGEAGEHIHGVSVYASNTYTAYAAYSKGTNTHTQSVLMNSGVHTHDSDGLSQSHNHGNNWRPYAAVGTRQHMKGII